MPWSQRKNPDGWDTLFTTVGGKPIDQDPLDLLDGDEWFQAERRLSQVMVATTTTGRPPDPDAEYWAAVVAKIVQRGARPPIPRSTSESIRGRSIFLDAAAVRSSLIFDPVDLQPSIELHATYEQPFWDKLCSIAPFATGWCYPQAPLEALAGVAGETERWVDFLFTVPWSPVGTVLEIDGSGHERSRGSDRERDRLLSHPKLRVERIRGEEETKRTTFLERLRDQSDSRIDVDGPRDPTVDRIVLGPAQIHRFMFALAIAVERGMLRQGETWNIALREPTGAVARSLGAIFELLDAVAATWKVNVVPSHILVNDTRWAKTASGQFVSMSAIPATDALLIDLDPHLAAHHRLPEVVGQAVVIRGALFPIELGFDGPKVSERRNVTSDGASREALRRLLEEIFGYSDFREGQLEALTRVLSGGDACVLLPTGSGKTLIYQMAGLLRPGLCLIVAPLKSLIDDQERRLRELGIDRVIGFHSGKGYDKEDKAALHHAVASGQMLFCLVAPERLQIAGFREALGEAASESLVNLAVVDEAHCVSEWGHQFRTAYLRLGRNLRLLARGLDDIPPPILALTGTASPAVLRDVLIELEMDPDEPGVLHRPHSFDRPNLRFSFKHTEPNARHIAFADAIGDIAASFGRTPSDLARQEGAETLSGLVFVPHKNSGSDLGIETYTEHCRHQLSLSATEVARYAGEKWKAKRKYRGFGKADLEAWGVSNWDEFKSRNADAFRNNEAPVMVSTNAFGMGIDKPNIRWTVHVAHPNSLEALGQEAGRAGRNGELAQCVVLTAPSTARNSDLEIQRFFHTQSFPDLSVEHKTVVSVANELLEVARPLARVVIPRIDGVGDGYPDDVARDRERALYRLMIVGLVDDYTIEYKAGTFTVDLADYSSDSLLAAVRGFISRTTAGQTAYEVQMPSHTAPLQEQIAGYAEVVLHVLHATVVPGRERALEEMHRVAVEAPSNDEFHQRLDAYLGAGMMSMLLDRVSRTSHVDIAETVAELEQLQPATRQEWAASSARFLESYPDHPVMLLVRGLGEAWLEAGDRVTFKETLEHMMGSLRRYDLAPQDGLSVVRWSRDALRRYYGGDRWSWASDVWSAWDATGWDGDLMQPLEDLVLDQAEEGTFHPEELDVVLLRAELGD